MPWYAIVVRDSGRNHGVVDIGPVGSEREALAALFETMQHNGFKPRVAGQHDKGAGVLVEGINGDGEPLVAIAWPTETMSQGALEIFFERLGLLRQAWSARPCPAKPALVIG